jgi:hypothetical protein
MKQLTAVGTPALFGEPGDNENVEEPLTFEGMLDEMSARSAPLFDLRTPASRNLQAGLLNGKGRLFTGGPGQSLGPNGNGNGNGNGFALPSWWPWAAVGGGAVLLWALTRKGK